MNRYRVEFSSHAARQFRKFPASIQGRIRPRILALAADPRPAGAVKLTGLDAFRIRVGDYRVIYEIRDDVLLVLVLSVGHRREVYG
ncbi:MAG TPA: type II toxin-antitoxin system RelE/ParE family toxin [Thermoanaerobaculia bacterium]|nr:type II toxin-antitoxin system RelE/ParE family toxin [Thermoanaerobaculia bacterium]